MLKFVNRFVYINFFIYLCTVRNKQLIKYLYIYEKRNY